MSTSTFSLIHIFLLESNFQRHWELDLKSPDFKNSININISNSKTAGNLNIFIELRFSAGVDKKEEISSFIKMVGIFTIPENNELSLETFANINGPAIMFPFIREHLASLSIKAGLNPILLQPINFVTHSQKSEEEN